MKFGSGLHPLCLYAATKFAGIRQGVPVTDERVHLGKALVFQTDSRCAALPQFISKETCIIEVSEARIAIDENRCTGQVSYSVDDVDHLGPVRFIGIAKTKAGGYGKSRCPQAFKSIM